MMFTPDLFNGHEIDTTGRCEVRHGTRILRLTMGTRQKEIEMGRKTPSGVSG
jgi:hypothetical protein